MSQYVFGPVPSRRLGQSLGIDTIPLKTCNWNCVYCQLGRSKPLINQRKAYFPTADILAEVKDRLQAVLPGEIDWVTFVGSGEPTLHADMGWLIREVKALTDLPVAVITNGSLLYLPEVRQELALADAVLPTLDAGSAALYRQIDRPHPDLSYQRLIEGLRAFRQMYAGQLWLETMLIKGLNDGESALRDLAAVLQTIQPDQVHLLLPDRPPAETWVEPAGQEALLRATAILGDVAHVLHPAIGKLDFSGRDDIGSAILAVITRHPLSEEQLLIALARQAPGQGDQILKALHQGGRVQIVERYGTRFWSAAPGHYPTDRQSQRTDPRHRTHT